MVSAVLKLCITVHFCHLLWVAPYDKFTIFWFIMNDDVDRTMTDAHLRCSFSECWFSDCLLVIPSTPYNWWLLTMYIIRSSHHCIYCVVYCRLCLEH